MKRRFMKNYAVVRNLVFNPRTPIDVSLGLMKNILIADLQNLMRQQRSRRHHPQDGACGTSNRNPKQAGKK